MKIVIKLNKSNGDRGNGFEIILYCNHLRTRKQKVIGYSKVEHFNEDMQLVNEKHPDYEELLPRLMELKLKARKIIAQGCIDVNVAMQALFSESIESLSFIKWCDDYIETLRLNAIEADKRGDLIVRNKINGNYRANLNSLNQFKKFYPNIKFSELNYNRIIKFREHYEQKGARNRTIVHYISHLKSMYHKGIRNHNIEDNKPFYGILDNLSLKSYDAKKKYITINDIKTLENCETSLEIQRTYIDIFLLQFYLGGCDLTDIYFMKKAALFKDRIIIERGKTGQVANLKLHSKAINIINKYKSIDGVYLFPWPKDLVSYSNFRSSYHVSLKNTQSREGINILPMGGNLSVKVTRHSFANRAKQLMIDADIIRELMAHERNDVDNFYKDKFSEVIRDEALFKIIET